MGRRRRDRTGATASVVLVAGALAACHGRSRPESQVGVAPKVVHVESDGPTVAEIDLSRGVPEVRTASLFGSSSHRSYADLIRILRDLQPGARDSSSPAAGVFVRLGTAPIGFAHAQEIGALLGEVRKKKPVICHADEYENATLMLAARACSRIWLSPAGSVEAVGIAAQLLYGNRLLERLNVTVNYLQVGKYKGAEEPFTRDGPSPEARASLEGALRGLRGAWRNNISEGRGRSEAADLIESGPYTPNEAVANGLIDAVGYADDARDEAKKLSAVEKTVTRFGGGDSSSGSSHGLMDALRAITGSSHVGTPHVAVLTAVGAISMKASPSFLGGGDGINERDLGKAIARLSSDPSTKAVVLRIDSPGGSALASDLLWKRLMKLRANKKLVVSVGEMAASGGYYLACTGDKIVAEPTSIVGSIGVVGGKLSVGRALEGLGVHAEIIAAAPEPAKASRAAYMSALTPWDDATRERVAASMTSVYELFLTRVAEGRGSTVDKVASFAEGQVFSGEEGQRRGMVDALGGLGEAIDLAIKLAGLPEKAPVDLVGNDQGLFDLLEEGGPGIEGEEREGADDPSAEAVRRAATRAVFPVALQSMAPIVGAFVGSLSPFLSGERALCAMPYGLVVR